MSRHQLILFLFLLLPVVSFTQESLHPLEYNPVLRHLTASSGVRTIGTERDTLCLPFFDDFSNLNAFHDSVSVLCNDTVYNTQPSAVYPNYLFWMDSLAFVNNTYPILPPSYGVATLDGLRGNGRPHSDINVYGPADTLTSRPFYLGGSLVDTVYLSFYYQPGGFGDFPEDDDSLVLEFKDLTGDWNRVWFARNTAGDFNQDFKVAMVAVADPAYLYDGFQFRFRNRANVKGNNDHWHIDYVYMDEDRTFSDTLFRDVSFTSPPTRFLKKYTTMPWKQFRDFQSDELNDNQFIQIINNFNAIINTSHQFRAFETWTGTEVAPLTAPISINFDPFSTTFNTYSTFTIPETTPGYDEDSLSITFEYRVDPAGDIQRLNDTMLYRQDFYNYFAYDDGTAEKAYALNGTGSKLAIRFEANEPDTLKEIYIHWAYVDGPKSTLFFSLMVWSDIDTTGISASETILYQADFLSPKYVDSVNGWYVYKLTDFLGNPTPVVVDDHFYVGWLQTQSDFLNVGFDANNDGSNHVFYTTGGNWQRSEIPGAIMIRPQVGGNYSVYTDLMDSPVSNNINIYPNPANNQIYIDYSGAADSYITVYNMTGSVVQCELLSPVIEIGSLASGMYILEIIDAQTGFAQRKQFIKN
jgi:hypothetical protein